MLKLSIIVPVYNVEQYLAKCIDSLLRQDLASEEYEVILVDDGSTDNSGRIADTEGLRTEEKGMRIEDGGMRTEEKGLRKQQYQKPATGLILPEEGAYKTPRIRVIHQPNMGLSAARNAGLRIAEGKYVQFVDSDDYLEPNVLGGLVRQTEEQELDVLRFDYQDVREVRGKSEEVGGKSEEVRGKSEEIRVYEVFWPYKEAKQIDRSTEVVDGETYLSTRMNNRCYAWQFIVLRSLCSDFLFTEGIYYEDVDWTPRMLLRAERVGATTTIAYNYLQRDGSITKAIDEQIRKKEIENKLFLIERLVRIKEQRKSVDWCDKMIAELVTGTLDKVSTRAWSRVGDLIRDLRRLKALPLQLEQIEKRKKRKARIINASPMVYALLMRMTQKR